jgi:hypothetical protein
MAVIVTDHNSKSGATISGDTVAIVIVQTNSGYKNDPGHAGTGTVVATLCTGSAGSGSGGSNSGAVTCTSSDDDDDAPAPPAGKPAPPAGKPAPPAGKAGAGNGVKCESLLANLSVASGSTVTGGQTVSILYADDSALLGTPQVMVDTQAVTPTVTTTSDVKPVYVDTYGGSASTKSESLISFKIPTGLAAGSHTITVTVQDGDGDYDVYSFTVKV